MARKIQNWVCEYCGTTNATIPERSFLGFYRFTCPMCARPKRRRRLSNGYRIGYLVALIFISLSLYNAYYMEKDFQKRLFLKTGESLVSHTFPEHLLEPGSLIFIVLLLGCASALFIDFLDRHRSVKPQAIGQAAVTAVTDEALKATLMKQSNEELLIISSARDFLTWTPAAISIAKVLLIERGIIDQDLKANLMKLSTEELAAIALTTDFINWSPAQIAVAKKLLAERGVVSG